MRSVLPFFILSAAVFAAGTPARAPATPPDFNTLIEQGRASLTAFDIPSAQHAWADACPQGRLSGFPPDQAALCEHDFGALAEALGRDEEAASHYRNSLALWEKCGPAYLPHRISTLTNLGGVYRRRRLLADAEAVLSQAHDLVMPLAAANPSLYATVLGRAGALYGDLDQSDRAHRMLDEAIATLRTLPQSGALELAYAYDSLGMLDLRSGHYKAGESNLRQALALSSMTFGEDNPETAAYSTDLALALLIQGQYNGAGTLLRRARFVIESRLGPDSFQLINVLAEQTSVEKESGHFAAAEDYCEKAILILNRRLAANRAEKGSDEKDSVESILLQVNLGNLYVREHKIADAERVLPSAVAAERRLLKGRRTLADGLRDLAALRSQQHAWSEAESLYREAIGLYERNLGPDHPDIAPVLRDYAAVLKHQGAPKAEVKNIEARARSLAG
ncbi:MAG TPA: tetratricopeptide repeat protein [Bryobacteraceae bacterium]|nr:tetratricopeptide repeat protein [Bryobacteraceae bacterium]